MDLLQAFSGEWLPLTVIGVLFILYRFGFIAQGMGQFLGSIGKPRETATAPEQNITINDPHEGFCKKLFEITTNETRVRSNGTLEPKLAIVYQNEKGIVIVEPAWEDDYHVDKAGRNGQKDQVHTIHRNRDTITEINKHLNVENEFYRAKVGSLLADHEVWLESTAKMLGKALRETRPSSFVPPLGGRYRGGMSMPVEGGMEGGGEG